MANNVKLPAQGIGDSVPIVSSVQLADGSHVENIQLGTISGGVFTPTPLALDATLAALIALLPASLGQKAMAQSLAVAIASDQSALPVSGSVAISGAVTTTPPANQSVNEAQVGGSPVATNAGNASAGTQRVVIASDQAVLPMSLAASPPVQAANAALTNVPASISSTPLASLNAARKGLVIVNDSTSILYVKFGTTASPTSWTYLLAGSSGGIPSTLELPAVVYTGLVTGIWVSATGAARVTELT